VSQKIVRRVDVLLMLAVLAVTTQPAHAYLDANTGSMIVQIMLGGVAGLFVFMRLLLYQLLSALGLKNHGHSGTTSSSTDPPDPQ